MIRVLVAALLGAIMLFVWGTISWTVLPWHNTSGGMLPDEAAVVELLSSTVDESGVYWIPGMPEDESMDEAEMAAAQEQWQTRHRAGPRGLLVYHPDGAEPMDPMVFVRGFLIYFAGAIVAAMLLSAAGAVSSYIGRVAFVAMLGVFTGICADLSYWNWMYFPTDFSLVNATDHVLGWLLAGLIIAALVKPKPRAAA